MSEIPNYIEKIQPFFKENVDFASITKPTDVLDIEIEKLAIFEESWKPFFEEIDLKTIKDFSISAEPLMIEGLNPDELGNLILISEMIFWHITQIAEHGEQKKKIVMFGLGNAGKTSALTALTEKYSSIKSILPTRGLVRQSTNILGYDLMAFDMGGQEEYQKAYFDKADMYFSAADLVIYCLDIQDHDRYEESLAYFEKILKTYEDYKLFPPVLVAFTKLDPDLAAEEPINRKRIDLIEKIEGINSMFDIGYTNSSIFDRNSIEGLFSLALKRISTSGGVIQELLKQFNDDINAQACTLISSSGLVYGSYGKDRKEEEMLNNSAAYLQNLYLFHVSQGLQKEDFYMLEYKRNNLKFISEYITESDSGMVYLWILTNDLRSEVLGIVKFRDEIMPLIKLFI